MENALRFTTRMSFLIGVTFFAWGRAHAVADDTRAAYFPDVTLKTQDNKDVRFYQDLVKDKIVIINLMYTRCDGKLCDQGTKNLARVQEALGEQLGREVFMYSITLDPEHDTPDVLKKYAETHGAKPGWTFLTGKEEEITQLRRKLGLFDSNVKKDADRTQHSGMIVIGNDSFNKWNSVSILAKPERILEMVERTKPPTPSKK